MFERIVLVVFALLFESFARSQFPVLIESEVSKKDFHTFPKDFSFGASTAAYQIEGGWKDDGKGPSIWDTITHNHPELIADHSTADIGADSYHFYKNDVKALKQVGVSDLCFQLSTIISRRDFLIHRFHSLSIIAFLLLGPEYSHTVR